MAIISQKLVDLGAHYSFACRESTPFAGLERLRREDQRFSWLRGAVSGFLEIEACRVWDIPPAPPLEHLPVISGIPTLLLAGEYDPATPPSNACSVAKGLIRSYVFEFPGLGHWVTANPVNDCPNRIALAFLDDPRRAPPGGCVMTMRVEWALEPPGSHPAP